MSTLSNTPLSARQGGTFTKVITWKDSALTITLANNTGTTILQDTSRVTPEVVV